jgi:hypothetical protein
MVELPTSQEWAEWEANPVTRALKQYLKSNLEDLKTTWASGALTRASVEESHQKNLEAVTQAQLLSDLCDLSYDDLSIYHEEHTRGK